jgi:hypothetical protein
MTGDVVHAVFANADAAIAAAVDAQRGLGSEAWDWIGSLRVRSLPQPRRALRSVNRNVTVPVGSSADCLSFATRTGRESRISCVSRPDLTFEHPHRMASRRAVLRRQRSTFEASDAYPPVDA